MHNCLDVWLFVLEDIVWILGMACEFYLPLGACGWIVYTFFIVKWNE